MLKISLSLIVGNKTRNFLKLVKKGKCNFKHMFHQIFNCAMYCRKNGNSDDLFLYVFVIHTVWIILYLKILVVTIIIYFNHEVKKVSFPFLWISSSVLHFDNIMQRRCDSSLLSNWENWFAHDEMRLVRFLLNRRVAVQSQRPRGDVFSSGANSPVWHIQKGLVRSKNWWPQ